MLGIITICASVSYGKTVSWSLLESLPSSPFLHLAAFLVIIQLSLTSAIGNSALYQHVEDCMGIARCFNKKRCIIRSTLMVLATILGESVPRFDLVMSMIGTTLTGPIAFVLPPLFYIKMLRIQEEHEIMLRKEVAVNVTDEYQVKNNRMQVCLSVAIAIFGIVSIVVTTYLNVVAAMEYGVFTKPCIYNFTMYFSS